VIAAFCSQFQRAKDQARSIHPSTKKYINPACWITKKTQIHPRAKCDILGWKILLIGTERDPWQMLFLLSRWE
jgi:hypothetical protein